MQALLAGTGTLITTLGAIYVARRNSHTDLERSAPDFKRAATEEWRQIVDTYAGLFNQMKAQNDGLLARIVSAENRLNDCEAKHEECERKMIILQHEMAALKG